MASNEIADRLFRFRAHLDELGLDGFIVPLTDEHQSEYVADYAKRLAWLTGFTGSAGHAIILKEKAAVFSDGRYTLQLDAQVDGAVFEKLHSIKEPPLTWLATNVGEGDKIGYDPFLHTIENLQQTESALQGKKAHVKPVTPNPIDAVWNDQPGEPNRAVVAHGLEYAGKSSEDKRSELAEGLKKKVADAAVITALDSIAWLFNIRSGDVLHTPVSLAFALLNSDGSAVLFLDESKSSSDLKAHLGNRVELRSKEVFLSGLEALGENGRSVLVDPASASAAIFQSLEDAGANIIKDADPCALPKAKKNDVEISGTKRAHVRDGATVTKILRWIDERAAEGGLSELDVVAKLREFRGQNDKFQDLSFDTIAGAGPNGAVIHYRVNEETNRKLEKDSVFLMDSGAQYLDGTTDITRTMAIGSAPIEARDRFTRVLKGHIALATAVFPEGTTGPQLDSFARRPLWEAGLDYDHGTGHGVGSYLAVHEGPGRIASVPNSIALEPGMIYSNEPGYYKPGAYGIRIENLVVVIKLVMESEQPMLGFETITMAPIDRNMILPELLNEDERGWLNTYHAQVRESLSPTLKGEDLAWLKAATEPIG